MYHKLGRPKRTVKAELISIQEPGCEPVFYRFDNHGSLIQNHQINKYTLKSKLNNISFFNEKSTSENDSGNNNSLNKEQNLSNENNSYSMETNRKEVDIKFEDLSDINYFLNKKPFPSLLDFDTEPIFIPQIQPLLVS